MSASKARSKRFLRISKNNLNNYHITTMYCLEVIQSPSYQTPAKPGLRQDPCSAVFPRDSRGRLRPSARAIVRCASARSAESYSPEATQRLWYFRRNQAAMNAFIETLYYTDDLTLATCAAMAAKHKRGGWQFERERSQWGSTSLRVSRKVRGLETRFNATNFADLESFIRRQSQPQPAKP